MHIVHLSNEELMKQRNKKWDFKNTKPYLFPKFKIQCPICNSNNVSFKHVQFFRIAYSDKNKYSSYRGDVYFKCMDCFHVFVFGVPITEKEYKIATQEKSVYYWCEI